MILVTGASGFVGKKLVNALVQEYGADKILAFTSRPTTECHYLLHNDYTFENDYVIGSGYHSITTIIHVGAFIPKHSSESNNFASCKMNIDSTFRLLQLKLPTLKKFVFLSTVDVYGQDVIVHERSPIEPVSLYGYSKLYCEKMISSWAKTNSKMFLLLRVGHIYGPGEEAYQKLIPSTMKRLLLGQPLQICGTGNEIRSLLFIDNLVDAILKSVKIDADLGIINLVSATKITVKELIDMLLEISGIDATVETIAMKGEGRNLIFDNSKMRRELGQLETPLKQGLTKEWEYMKQLNR